mgnify:CR=1 FL=1
MTSEIKVNKIVKASGSTLTLGGCGTAVQLGTGATQSGFGRTGSVNWQTTKKTGNFSAVSGEGYFVDTSGTSSIMTLPSSPSAGDIVAVRDYASTFDSNNLTIARNSQPLMGNAGDKVVSTKNISLTLVYVDSTKGWIPIEEGTGDIGITPTFISASGGNSTITCGNFKTHVFTSPGTFTVSSVGNPSGGGDTVDYLVIAGGGSGGFDGGGGGGGGGFRVSNSASSGLSAPSMSPLVTTTALTVTATGFPITIGAGGTCKPSTGVAPSGSASTFSSITSAGGGGGSPGGPTCRPAGNGGSGGGTDRGGDSAPQVGSGNTPPVSPPQGSPGNFHPGAIGGGGGGADPSGAAPQPGNSGNGGTGSFVSTTFFGTSAPSFGTTGPSCGRYFSGGGAGGTNPSSISGTKTGGSGGGGNVGTSASANTGGGGGAGEASGPISQTGKSGGSGIIAIRYKFQ